jgi:hypothetical protein
VSNLCLEGVKNVLMQRTDKEKMKEMSLLQKVGVLNTECSEWALCVRKPFWCKRMSFMTEMRMSREEALRPLFHPVQTFFVEIVMTPS